MRTKQGCHFCLARFFQSRSLIKQQEKPDGAAGEPKTYGVFPSKQAPENHCQNKGNFPAAWPTTSLVGVKPSQPADHLLSSSLKTVAPTLKHSCAPSTQRGCWWRQEELITPETEARHSHNHHNSAHPSYPRGTGLEDRNIKNVIA